MPELGDGLTPKWGSFGNSNGGSEKSSNESKDKSQKQKKREAPVSLRLTFTEKKQLKEMAGRQSVNAYIKARLFDPDAPIRQARGLNPVKDQQALAQVLGMLGSSGLPKHMAEMAEAAKVGALPVDDDTQKSLRQACDDIRIMRRFLLAALGIQETATQPVTESCRSAFSRAKTNTGDKPLDHEDFKP
ncbi:MAG: hypothetical protein ACFBZ9_10940 [Sphingomonadales bacterium]